MRVGLQAIHAADRSVVAHELLFRAPGRHDASLTGRSEHDHATAQVITATFGEFGAAELGDGKPLFLNTTRSFFTGELPLPFSPDGVVLELLETVDVDHVVMQGIRRLRARGFAIAVDDFDGELHRVPALRFADYVKLDLEASGDRLPGLVDLVRRANPRARLVVERIETVEQFERCVALGVEMFQGYLLHRPDIVQRQTLDASHLTCVQLIAALHDLRTSTEDVLRLLTHDPGLSLRILKTVGSAAHAPRQGITSLHQAVVLLGRRELASWVTLVLVGGTSTAAARPDTLGWIFTRAEACRALAPEDPDAGFTVGLLSAAAAVLGVTPADLTRGCSLSEEVQEALVHGRGRLGAAVEAVVAQEGTATGEPVAAPGVDLSAEVYLHATLAARSRVKSLSAVPA
jgi:EAL and modified HD-GYP domain-containing signal transduction protein